MGKSADGNINTDIRGSDHGRAVTKTAATVVSLPNVFVYCLLLIGLSSRAWSWARK